MGFEMIFSACLGGVLVVSFAAAGLAIRIGATNPIIWSLCLCVWSACTISINQAEKLDQCEQRLEANDPSVQALKLVERAYLTQARLTFIERMNRGEKENKN